MRNERPESSGRSLFQIRARVGLPLAESGTAFPSLTSMPEVNQCWQDNRTLTIAAGPRIVTSSVELSTRSRRNVTSSTPGLEARGATLASIHCPSLRSVSY